MKIKINYSDAQNKIIEQATAIMGAYTFNEADSALTSQEILNFCADVWGIPNSELIGKIQHSNRIDKARKSSLIYCCRFFSNDSSREIAQLTGCTNIMFRNCKTIICEIFRSRDNISETILSLIDKLNKKTQGRFFKILTPSLDCLHTTVNEVPHLLMTGYQISRVPVRDRGWFELAGQQKNMYIFHISNPPRCHFIIHKAHLDSDKLFKLQDNGYRFVRQFGYNFDALSYYQSLDPICDRCLNCNGCSLKTIRDIRLDAGLGDQIYQCFQEHPSTPLKSPIELLYPLETHQLQ